MNTRRSVPKLLPKTSPYSGRMDDSGKVINVAPYVLQDISMKSLLDGSIPVPSVGADTHYNGIDLNEVTRYARDPFEGLEAMKASLGVVNNTIDAERSTSSDKE